jgi:hypothetical protein
VMSQNGKGIFGGGMILLNPEHIDKYAPTVSGLCRVFQDTIE